MSAEKSVVRIWVDVPGEVHFRLSELLDGDAGVVSAEQLMSHLRADYLDPTGFADEFDLVDEVRVTFQVDHVDENGKTTRTTATWDDGE